MSDQRKKVTLHLPRVTEEFIEIHLHFLVCLYGVVFQHRHNFTLPLAKWYVDKKLVLAC